MMNRCVLVADMALLPIVVIVVIPLDIIVLTSLFIGL